MTENEPNTPNTIILPQKISIQCVRKQEKKKEKKNKDISNT